MRGSSVLLLVFTFAACRTQGSSEEGEATVVAPNLRVDVWDIYQELEQRIAADQADEAERARAYRRVRVVLDDGSARYAFVRAALAGRLAETRGIKAARLIKETETWARRSILRDPEFEDGAAKRMLGTLYVMAPARFLEHGDSETGLEMLEELTQARSDVPLNHLRLAQGYISLGDPEPAGAHLCRVASHLQSLRADDRQLYSDLVEEYGAEALTCEE